MCHKNTTLTTTKCKKGRRYLKNTFNYKDLLRFCKKKHSVIKIKTQIFSTSILRVKNSARLTCF